MKLLVLSLSISYKLLYFTNYILVIITKKNMYPRKSKYHNLIIAFKFHVIYFMEKNNNCAIRKTFCVTDILIYFILFIHSVYLQLSMKGTEIYKIEIVEIYFNPSATIITSRNVTIQF